MTITIGAMSELKDVWVNAHVQILSEPFYDQELQQWVALANAYGMLAFVTLRVTPMNEPAKELDDDVRWHKAQEDTE